MDIFQRIIKIILSLVVTVTPNVPLIEAPASLTTALAESSVLSSISEEVLANPYDSRKLYYLDLLTYLDSKPGISSSDYYDIALIMGVLQGLVNRDGVHFYIRFTSANNADEVWFERLTSNDYWTNTLGKEPQFLAGMDVVKINSPMDALYLFQDFFNGYAVWDGNVPATSNSALTASGCDSLLPLRYSSKGESIFSNLTNLGSESLFNFKGNFEKKPVKINLYNKFVLNAKYVYGTGNQYKSTGSRKCDAVLWAVYNYLEAGKTNAHLMAYHIDAYYPAKTQDGETDYNMGHIQATAFLLNNDYYIAKKAFFFDLNVMKKETPNDDPDQADIKINYLKGSLDYQTAMKVLKAQNNRAAKLEYKPITCGGFTAWHIKYTSYITTPGDFSGLSSPFVVEWQTVREFSNYNVMLDADAPGLVAMSDASVFMHYPKQASYTQKCDKNIADSVKPVSGENFNYVMVYMGDYDSASWLSSQSLLYWDNPERGTVPLAWSFAPGLYDRAPHIIDYMYATATKNDYFVAGDNGVGYLNPEVLAGPCHFGTLKQWTQYNAQLFKKFDMNIQGFLIFDKGADTLWAKALRQSVYRAYSTFAPKGLLTNNADSTKKVNFMPVVQMYDCDSADGLASHFSKNPVKDGSRFTAIRVVLKPPAAVKSWIEEINTGHPEYKLKLVDPYTFMALYSQAN
ncbi:MAG: hypothetical protein WCN92_06635 [Eubacteriales bacterium]